MRVRLDGLWCDEDFADWYPRDGRPGLSPAQLATVLQFLLGLSDRQAAEAARCRIDFKYAMAMELDVSPKMSVLTDSSTSRWPASRRPDWCASAPRSEPTPPTSWPWCAT
ncbi:transposase [Streptomyces sp. NPDC060022]|uniref:transposase n=1 Tax=Streptomyces sp. NPDC060022 TaxID=3347039 RepID=UPI0036AE0237